MWKIGDVEIPHRVVLAPMAGITNKAYRSLVKEFGAGLLVSEMISDKAICYRNKKTLDMLEIEENEHPMSIQLFGGEVDTMVEAAKYIEENTDCDILDINMGCPVSKVIKAHAGSDLMRDPSRAYDIMKAIVDHVSIPVSVKMRLGYDSHHINVIELAQLAEKAGVSAITVHGRTRSQFYEGEANWDIIKQVKESVSIPVIGNGDIKNPIDAKKRLDESGVDAIMVGRAVLGNPWLLKRIIRYIEDGVLEDEPDYKEKIQLCKNHALRLVESSGERIAIKEMRGHAPWYLKGLRNSAQVKNKLTQITTYQELENILDNYLIELGE